jgi:hypothetical protein
LKDGAPPIDQEQPSSFVIFSSGKQFRGTVTAGVDHDAGHLAVSLAGESNAGGRDGMSRVGEKIPFAEQAGSRGSFTAGLSGRRGVFHFSGGGEITVDKMHDLKSRASMEGSSSPLPLADQAVSVTNVEIPATPPAVKLLNGPEHVPVRVTGRRISNSP